MGKVKLHIGCGGVYLEGYINIDVKIDGYSFLTSERPDLMTMRGLTADSLLAASMNKRPSETVSI